MRRLVMSSDPLHRMPLREGWSFKQADADDEWLSVRQVPTNVHLDLLDHNK